MEPKQKPFVSVIIPTHNRASLLRGALASVYAQEGAGEHFDMEVIVVDDDSTDATPEVVRQFAVVQYIRLDTNRGLPVARNVGIKMSTGKYVAFLDDDDLWLPYKLSMLVPVLETHPNVGVAYGQVIVKFGNEVSVWPELREAPSGSVFRAMLRQNFAGMNSVLVRREAFEKAGYFDESLSSNVDYDMCLRLAFYSHFKFVRGPVAIYRLSKRGTLLTAAAAELSNFPRVVEKALAMLPATTQDYQQVSREARACAIFRVAETLEMMGELKKMRAYILKALEEFPWIARESWARSWIVQKVSRLSLASDSPIDAVQAFCADTMIAVRGRGLRERLGVRRLLADVWTGAAITLGNNGSPRAAGYAAACAVLYDPRKLGQKAVLKLLGRPVAAVVKKLQ